ncbi:MAG TPA: glycosyltransferase family 39 protein [Anaerolineales bacterium]|nr:glycosyltransferase family 39 protein [Anaerolineales bacterium]
MIVVTTVSVLARVLAAFALGNEIAPLPGTADQVSYHALAQRVVSGYGFSFGSNWWPMTAADAPTAHWSFLYTGFLAAIYAVVQAPLAARLLQALVVGILHPFLAYRIGKQAFGDMAGLVAAGMTALYTYFIYYSGTLMTEPFYITAVLGVLYLAIRLAGAEPGRESLRLTVWLGLVMGTAVLLRQLFLLLIPVLFFWLWVARKSGGTAAVLRIGLVSTGIVALMILPFTVYNSARFDRFVLLNTNAGYAFYLANHPFYGTDFIPASEMDNYQALVPAELRDLDEASLDQVLLRRGLGFVADDPVRYLLLSLDRIPEYFKFWPSPDSGMLSNIARVTSFGLTLPWMLAGLWIWLRGRWGDRFRDALGTPGSLLLFFALVYSALHVFSWALVRYRLPVDAALLPFAGLAGAALIERFARHAGNRSDNTPPPFDPGVPRQEAE